MCLCLGDGRDRRDRQLLSAGDHVVVTDNTYGGTFRLFDKILTRYKLEFSYVDTSQPQLIEQALRPSTKMLFVETPTNPVMRLTDIAVTRAIAKSRNLTLVVDNTFASPVLQRPLTMGADLVVHSTTKYLNGHSDSVGGIVVAARADDDSNSFDSFRTPPARSSARSIRGWSCAARRRSPCEWRSTTPTAWRWRASWSSIRRSAESSTPASPAIRSTSWPGGRCADSVGCCRSTSATSSRRDGCAIRSA